MRHKRGTTFRYSGQADNEGALNLSGWTGRSQVRTENDVLVDQLTFVWDDATTGQFTVSSDTTDDWPIGAVYFDVFFDAPAPDTTVIATVSRRITVIKNQTRSA